jgi:hypothetical protein
MIAFRLNTLYRPEDFSIGNKFLSGKSIIDKGGNWETNNLTTLEGSFARKIQSVEAQLKAQTDMANSDNVFEQCKKELHSAITGGTDRWKFLVPGKELLDYYVRKEFGTHISAEYFTNLLVKELLNAPEKYAPELVDIIHTIIEEKDFT